MVVYLFIRELIFEREIGDLDCPACGNDISKVVSVTRWPTVDKRKLECKGCGYEYGVATMLVEDEPLLECAALVTRKWYVSREGYDPKNDKLLAYGNAKKTSDGKKGRGFSVVVSLLNKIISELVSLKRQLKGNG